MYQMVVPLSHPFWYLFPCWQSGQVWGLVRVLQISAPAWAELGQSVLIGLRMRVLPQVQAQAHWSSEFLSIH